MSITKQIFGFLPDGRRVNAYTLRNASGMTVKIMEYGGTVIELKAPDRYGVYSDVIGGYDSLRSYLGADGYQGAIIGRWGNRIAEGKFSVDGKEYTLAKNNGNNHLHGGTEGFNAKMWNVETVDSDEPSLILSYLSVDGEEGYPGNLNVKVTYTLSADNALSINYVAVTDKKTPINLTNHTYFNLGGYASGSIRSHILTLDASTYLPTDAGLIPTGEIKDVDGTPFDFRLPKEIGRDMDCDDPDIKKAGGYDHCFNFSGGQTVTPVKRAELYEPVSGRLMEVYTNQPCVQLYTGNFLKNAEFPFKGGYKQVPQTFLCLETQHMPDSVNHANFTDSILAPGEKYDFTTVYKFTVN